MFSNILDDGTYPQLWKTDFVKLVRKKDNANKEKNYRGISLSSCLGKFLNSLILTRLSKCFEELNLHTHT